MIKKLAIVLVLLVIVVGTAAGGYFLFLKTDKNKGKIANTFHQPRVTVIPVPESAETKQLKVIGNVEAGEPMLIVPKIGGRVVEVLVRDGQIVKKGQPILRIDDSQVRLAYHNAQMQFALTQSRLQLALMGQPTMPDAMVPNAMPGAAALSMQNEGDTIRIARLSEMMHPPMVQPLSQPDAPGLLPEVEAAGRPKANSPDVEKTMQELNQLAAKMHDLERLMTSHTLVIPRTGKIKQLKLQANDYLMPDKPIGELVFHKRPVISAKIPKKSVAGLNMEQTVLIQLPGQMTGRKAGGKILYIQPLSEIKGHFADIKVEMTQGNPSRLAPPEIG